jgi:hypothetical protein
MRNFHRFALPLRLAGVMGAAGALLTPAAARAQAAAAVIPSVQAKLLSLKFFETGPVMFAATLRTYAEKFETARTRYIGVELTFQHPAPGNPASFAVACAFRTASDSLMGQVEFPSPSRVIGSTA